MDKGGRPLPRRVALAEPVGEAAVRLGSGGADAVDLGDAASEEADDLTESDDEAEVDLCPPSFSVFNKLVISIHWFRASQAGAPAPAPDTHQHISSPVTLRPAGLAISNNHAKPEDMESKTGTAGEGLRKGNASRIAVFLTHPTTHARSPIFCGAEKGERSRKC